MNRRIAAIVLHVLGLTCASVEGAVKRAILVLPFEASSLAKEESWIGDAVAESLTLAFVQNAGFIVIDRARRYRNRQLVALAGIAHLRVAPDVDGIGRRG